MVTIVFYPHSSRTIEEFNTIIEKSDYWGEFNPDKYRFEFKEEPEMAIELKNELEFIARGLNGHFEIE